MLRHSSFRFSHVAVLAAVVLAACSSNADQTSAPRLAPRDASRDVGPTPPPLVVISQIYGGGGNGGATLKNDFIELFNGGTTAVSLEGWSVQYASSAGSFTASLVTPLSGSIAPGGYYLVQEGAGAGGTTSLPTPDASGGVAMSATSAKVALVSNSTPLGVACPAAGTVVDFVAYGTTVTGCGTTTPLLANATAALRKLAGCANSHSSSADFAVGTPAPRNSATTAIVCPPPATVAVTPTTANVTVGGTVALSALAREGGGNGVPTTFTWTSSDETIATVDAVGVVTGKVDGSSVTITATSANGKFGTSTVTVLPALPVATVTVTPGPTTTVNVDGTRALTATAKDADGNPTVTTFTWSSTDPGNASVDASGVVTGHILASTATISATSANGKVGSTVVTVTAPPASVTVSSRSAPLPIGFQTQLFASGTDKTGHKVPDNAPVTWSSSNSAAVTVDANGVITAAGTGSAQITATTADLTAGQTTITTEVGLLSAGARSGHNLELGTPTDANPNDDIIITRKQYTLSYNPTHAGPNWVSWNMDASHLGSLDRCNCFTQDTTLVRLGYPAYTTADYIAGGLWDRGHMEPSADQTTTDYENAYTFFLSNTLPQKHDLNAGPWEKLENALRDSARAPGGREVYVIAGGVFTGGVGLGTLNGLGKIGIPDSTWKIAVILPAGVGLGGAYTPAQASVIAVNMPNVVGISGNPWQMYSTSVSKIEASTGYNFGALIGEGVQCRIDARNCLPLSHVVPASGSSTTASGAAFTLNIGVTDGDGADGPWKLNVQWGDGSLPFNTTLSALPTDAHPFPRGHVFTGAPGTTFTVVVTITDKHGGFSKSNFVVTIAP